MTAPDDQLLPAGTGATSQPATDVAWPSGLLAFGLGFPFALTLGYFVALAGAPRAAQQAVYLAGKALQFGLPLAWLLLGRGARLGPRLPRTHRGWRARRGAGAGLAFGLAVFLAALTLYHLVLAPLGALAGAPAAAVRAKVLGLGVAGPGPFLALAAFYSLVHSLAEELYWRGFVFGGLRERGRPGAAVLWSSAAFTAHHVVLLAVFFGAGSPWTWVLSLAVGGGGAFWAWLYLRSGSLLGPWLGHALVDAAIFAIGWDLVR